MEPLLTKLVLLLAIAFQLFILIVLMRRRLFRRLRWFSIYIAYVLVEAGLRFGVAGNRALYFNVYWLTSIGSVILSLMAVRESFLNVFWVYTRFRWFTRAVWSCVGLAMLYSVFRAWAFPPVHASRITAMVIDLDLTLDYSLAAVGLLYFALVKSEKIREHQWESAVISGFMTIGALSAVGALIRSVFDARFRTLAQWLAPVAYILAEIEWAVVLSRPEQETPKWIRELLTT